MVERKVVRLNIEAAMLSTAGFIGLEKPQILSVRRWSVRGSALSTTVMDLQQYYSQKRNHMKESLGLN